MKLYTTLQILVIIVMILSLAKVFYEYQHMQKNVDATLSNDHDSVDEHRLTTYFVAAFGIPIVFYGSGLVYKIAK